MMRRILTIAALSAALAVPMFAQRWGGSFTSIQVWLGNFTSFSAWQHSHHRSRRYCRLDHYRQHRGYDRGCNICQHNRRYHGHYLERGGRYTGFWDRGRFWRWDPDNRYYGNDYRRGRYDDDWDDDDYYDRRRYRRYRD